MLCSWQWVIRPHPDTPARSRDTNRLHVYQLDLKKLKFLPYADYVCQSLLEKGKRKVTDNLGSLSPSKTATTVAPPLEWSDLQ